MYVLQHLDTALQLTFDRDTDAVDLSDDESEMSSSVYLTPEHFGLRCSTL